MKDLAECRKDIDEIDQSLAKFFLRRMAVAEEVAIVKQQTNAPVLDQKRENEKLNAVSAFAENEIGAEYLKRFFSSIMELSRDYQKKRMENKICSVSHHKIDKL